MKIKILEMRKLSGLHEEGGQPVSVKGATEAVCGHPEFEEVRRAVESQRLVFGKAFLKRIAQQG